jgi:hypothetical protein
MAQNETCAALRDTQTDWDTTDRVTVSNTPLFVNLHMTAAFILFDSQHDKARACLERSESPDGRPLRARRQYQEIL